MPVDYSNNMKHRGFTLIELLVVIAIISTLAGIVVLGFTKYRNRAVDGATSSLSISVASAAERYYAKNFEYPQLGTITSNGVPTAAHYTTISNTVNVPTTTLDGSQAKLYACSVSCTIPHTNGNHYVYYLTKSASSGTPGLYTIGSCNITIPSSEVAGVSYVLAYRLKESNTWKFYKSAQGNPTNSCSFS